MRGKVGTRVEVGMDEGPVWSVLRVEVGMVEGKSRD